MIIKKDIYENNEHFNENTKTEYGMKNCPFQVPGTRCMYMQCNECRKMFFNRPAEGENIIASENKYREVKQYLILSDPKVINISKHKNIVPRISCLCVQYPIVRKYDFSPDTPWDGRVDLFEAIFEPYTEYINRQATSLKDSLKDNFIIENFKQCCKAPKVNPIYTNEKIHQQKEYNWMENREWEPRDTDKMIFFEDLFRKNIKTRKCPTLENVLNTFPVGTRFGIKVPYRKDISYFYKTCEFIYDKEKDDEDIEKDFGINIRDFLYRDENRVIKMEVENKILDDFFDEDGRNHIVNTFILNIDQEMSDEQLIAYCASKYYMKMTESMDVSLKMDRAVDSIIKGNN